MTINEIKKWLEEELVQNRETVESGNVTDGTEDIIYGRSELASELLNLIDKS